MRQKPARPWRQCYGFRPMTDTMDEALEIMDTVLDTVVMREPLAAEHCAGQPS